MSVKIIRKPCPYCGCEEFVRGVLTAQRMMHPKRMLSTTYAVQCQICKRCGTIVRKFIASPDAFPDY